jgi:hypothetical protein
VIGGLAGREPGPRPPLAAPPADSEPAAGAASDLAVEPYRSLQALVGAMESLAAAVVRHDAAALEAATATAADLVARIERLAADGLDPEAGARGAPLDEALVTRLARRLEASARLAAGLIERAWASEAAALVLLARCLGAADGPSAYPSGGWLAPGGVRGPAGEPLVLERRA